MNATPETQAPTAAQDDPARRVRQREAWMEAMLAVARHYRVECSAESLRVAVLWNGEAEEEAALRQMARQAGLHLSFAAPDVSAISVWRLPLVARFKDGQVAVLQSLDGEGRVGLSYSGDRGLASTLGLDELQARLETLAVLRPARAVPDARVDDYIKPYEPGWFRRIVLRDLRPYGHVMLASLAANVLALAGVLFSMQVYDRVVPAQSYPTLYVLFGGVLLAVAFDFVLRRLRIRVIDMLGKRADLRVSDRVFGHALRVKNSARPASTGTFVSQLRELEQVRELLTSTTVTALADLPFFLLFLLVFWYIGGALVLVPLGALVLLIIPGLLAQPRLREYAQESMRDGSLRNAMLVEAVQGMEDIKVLQAEPRFQNQWGHYNTVTADANLRLRSLTGTLTAWTQNVQTAVFAVVVFFGAPMVMEGDLTTGSLVAASILASRMMAPMAQITQVMSRWQQAKVALRSLNHIMQLPVDHPEHERKVHRPSLAGYLDLQQAVFRYTEETPPALQVRSLKIDPGEKVAVLGRNGAGKSTLLQALSGMLEPVAGEVLLDGVRMSHLDPADVRRDVGVLTQNARLFHGTLRENLLLGAPLASDADIQRALAVSGADEFVRRLPKGLDHLVLEGGLGLSGGQRQGLLLARLVLRDPRVVLLDEPTASLDEAAEKKLIRHIRSAWKDRTVVVATHRASVLAAVDRIVVVEGGAVTLDGPRERIMAELAERSRRHAAAARPAAEGKSAGAGPQQVTA